MELNKKEKEKYWNDTKINILLILIVLFPIIVVVFSGEIAKTMSATRTHVIIASLPFVLFIEIIFLSLLADCAEKYEMLKKQEKLDEQLNKELQQIKKEHEENIAAHNYVFSEIKKHNYTMTYELLRITMLKGPEMRKEFETYVRSNPPKDHTSQLIDRLTRGKENTTSRVTPFPTKQETPKRANKESMREFIENHIQRMADLDYISEEINKNKYPITPELKSLLRNGYRNKNLRKDFDDYIRNSPPKGCATETFNLTKSTEAPGVNPILSDIINQIQTHGDNIIVKQQGQQITIKATLNQNNQNKIDQ